MRIGYFDIVIAVLGIITTFNLALIIDKNQSFLFRFVKSFFTWIGATYDSSYGTAPCNMAYMRTL